MSPELLNLEIQDRRQTKSSDCYALGMVIYEVLSGHAPFPRCNNHIAAMKVLKGERPVRPQGMEWSWFTGAGEVWEVLERCWVPQPGDRPSIEDVLQYLKEVSESWMPPSPRLLEVPPTVGSLSWGFFDTVTMENTDWSEEPPQVASSQLLGEPDQEEPVETVNDLARHGTSSHSISESERVGRSQHQIPQPSPNHLTSQTSSRLTHNVRAPPSFFDRIRTRFRPDKSSSEHPDPRSDISVILAMMKRLNILKAFHPHKRRSMVQLARPKCG